MTKEQRDALYRFVQRQHNIAWDSVTLDAEYYRGMAIAYREIMWILDPQSGRLLNTTVREMTEWRS